MESQFKKGALELCVLSILATKEYYGYELVQAISKVMVITEGTAYPLLRRLKDDGLVSTFLQESNEGPSRKYYVLTTKGKQQQKILLKEWKEFVKKMEKLL